MPMRAYRLPQGRQSVSGLVPPMQLKALHAPARAKRGVAAGLPARSSPASAETHTLAVKLLTVNTHKGFTAFNRRFALPELRDAIRTAGADVVFLQEVLGTHSRHSQRHANWPAAPQYEFLADQIWSDFAYGQNAVYPHGHHGNALLSKFPIVRHENRDVSIAGPERRGLLHCVMTLPASLHTGLPAGTELHAICVHLGLQERHRRQQVDMLCRHIEASVPAAAPLIVAGDFNDWQGRAHDPLTRGTGLREVFVELQGRAARTFPARFPVLRLDRIYVRNAAISSASVLAMRPWSHLSDHAALVAEVQL